MKQTDAAYIGIDVSKETLDIDAGEFGALKIANTPAEARKALGGIARRARAADVVTLHICFESTGPYTGALAAECAARGMPYSILNPYRVACFAKSVAQAKTDRIDASVIRRYAEARRPARTPLPDKAAAKLDEFLLARDAVMKCIVATRALLETVKAPAAAKPLERIIAFSEKKIAEYDRLIAGAVHADARTAGLVAALSSVKGVGTLTAAKVAAWMPEIGTLGRRKAAALSGLAPHTRESGKWKGRARIGGGRKCVRDALFMPATVAIRHDPHLRRVYEGHRARGKPHKVALAAVMRKLICHLDRVARDYRRTQCPEAQP